MATDQVGAMSKATKDKEWNGAWSESAHVMMALHEKHVKYLILHISKLFVSRLGSKLRVSHFTAPL